MKSKLMFSAYLSASIVAASSVGLGGYYLYRAIENAQDKGDWKYVELGKPKTIWFNSDTENANSDWDFQIKVYPYQDGSFWLDDKGLILLKERIKEKLYHGQEITTLNNIVFGDVNIIKKGSNGLYFPLTKEIFLNIETFKKYNNLSDEKKINGIMSTITHEYGHHISNMYFSSNKSSEAWKGDGENKPLVDGHQIPTHWNPIFTENFYRKLHYDDKSLLNDGHGGIQTKHSQNSKHKSVASKISLNKLFWSANGNQDLDFDKEYDLFALPSSAKKNYEPYGLRPDYDDQFLKYRYSLDEIITRQLGQLMHVYDKPSDPSLFGWMIRKNMDTIHWRGNSLDSFVTDTNTTSQLFYNKNSIISEDFYKDSVFRKTQSTKTQSTEDIYNNFRDAMGYHKMISNVYALNKSFASVDKDNGNKYARYGADDYNRKKISITGWAPEEVKGIFLGKSTSSEKDINDNLYKFESEEKRKSLWKFDRKNSVFGQTTVNSKPFMNGNKKWLPFATNKYLEATKDKQLKWWIDTNNDNSVQESELWTTAQVLNKHAYAEKDVINNIIPVSSFKQAWSEDVHYPQIKYKDNEKKLFINNYL